MHFNEVRAIAFGPFRNASLQLGPGFNVVHGPNEAGKSSWFAATYAGLAGRRKARGRGTLAQAEFRNKHKPWSGSQWSAGVTVTLDDGLVLTLEHDLGKAESRIVDSDTRRIVPIAQLAARLGIDLTTESTLDGARLLGLNRDSARATIFTGQADVLRVLDDAGELQEFLERAATTDVADATAEGALAWLGELRSQYVGSDHVGKKPLRARTEQLAQARQIGSDRRDQLIRLIGVITERQRIASQLDNAKEDVDRADRLSRWIDIRSLQQRLNQAETLSSQVNASATSAFEINEDRIRGATMILGAYDSGTDAQPLPEGATAAELEAKVNSLPVRPEGDLEPRAEILEARDELNRASTALTTHNDGVPAPGPDPATTSLEADELRTLADVLELQAPVSEPGLSEELASLEQMTQSAALGYREAQARYEAAIQRNEERRRAHAQHVADYARLTAEFEKTQAEHAAHQAAAQGAAEDQATAARRTGAMIMAGGLLLLVVGVVLAALGTLVLGVAMALAGALGLVVGLLARTRLGPEQGAATPDGRGSGPPAPRQPDLPELEEVEAPVSPPVNPRVVELQIALKAHENALREHNERLGATRARLRDHGLEADPMALRKLARLIDDAGAATDRRQQHHEQSMALLQNRDESARALSALVAEVVPQEVTEHDVARLLRAVDTYVAACRERAATAQLAARRTDLLAALEQRRQLEADRAAAAAERERQVKAVIGFVSELDESDTQADVSAEEAATRLRGWLAEQQEGRAEQATRSELTTRLDQLLEGRALAEWREKLAELIDMAGPEPEVIPADIEAFRAQVVERHELVVHRAGALVGEQELLSRGLASVAESLEVEAAAERALTEVQSLRTCLDAAIDQLNLAKDRAHANIAPALEGRVRPWLPRITEGRYLDVMVDPSDLTVKVTEHSGAVRDAQLLSQGTMEQIFLLLRIALAQVLSGDRETAPLILDDVTVQSDEERTTAILTMLHEVSADRQVVLFSQEQEVIDWANEKLTSAQDRVIALTGPTGR